MRKTVSGLDCLTRGLVGNDVLGLRSEMVSPAEPKGEDHQGYHRDR